MLTIAIKVLKKIEEQGFSAYIVGGFVRDYILGISSFDVDIATNATPKDLRLIFKNSVLPNESYGSVSILYQNIRFEITTFRKESTYLNHRRPSKVEYIDDLYEDLKRRDFKMNTLCMDSNGEILDLLGGRTDIDHKEISTVGNSFQKIEEDSLRILRAIRFATKLNFRLNDELKRAILINKESLRELSYERKKQELDRIFSSSNAEYGIQLLLELELDKVLDLYNLKDIKLGQDLLGTWASLKVSSSYPFSRNERVMIKQIQSLIQKKTITNYDLYHYGPYLCTLASSILNGENKNEVMRRYQELPIFSKKDIALRSTEIMKLLKSGEGPYLKEIFLDLEEKILDNKLQNEKSVLVKYVLKHYSK